MNENTRRILEMSDGSRPAREIAENLGLSARYVRRVQARHNAPRLSVGARFGEANQSWRGGRAIDLDGYVLSPAPGHPNARMLPGKKSGRVLEHRLVMERKIGRFLTSSEIVDHIDGLKLHNAPENLRLFDSNSEHLRRTLQGRAPQHSPEGSMNIGRRTDLGQSLIRVDNYRLRREEGGVRLQQILLAWLSLGPDSPFLLGTRRHLKKAGISDFSRSSLERALADLSAKWAMGRFPLEQLRHQQGTR
jgi:hypothetical protein